MKKTLLLAFAALCFVQSALAWGKSGHDAVAYIAETHLTKRAKAVIERYLGHSIVYDASWMDDYRAEPGYEMTARANPRRMPPATHSNPMCCVN